MSTTTATQSRSTTGPGATALAVPEAAVPELRALFRSRPLADWVSLLEPADACVAPVQRFEEVLEDEQFRAGGAFIEVPAGSGRLTQVAPPVHSPAIDEPARSAPVEVGEHTAEVLAECGIDLDAVQPAPAQSV